MLYVGMIVGIVLALVMILMTVWVAEASEKEESSDELKEKLKSLEKDLEYRNTQYTELWEYYRGDKKPVAPITCINIGEALKEAEENDKMIIKKKTEITMEEFLHMLVDKGVLEGLTFNRYNGDWFNKHNVVNIELLTKIDFPKFEIHGGADMDRKVTLIEEIEIDEDTEFERLVEVNKSGAIHTYYDTSINEELWYGSSEFHIAIDDKLVKIWDIEKGMLE